MLVKNFCTQELYFTKMTIVLIECEISLVKFYEWASMKKQRVEAKLMQAEKLFKLVQLLQDNARAIFVCWKKKKSFFVNEVVFRLGTVVRIFKFWALSKIIKKQKFLPMVTF